MANSGNQFLLDPALLTPQALAGKAQLIPDPTAAFWTTLFKSINRAQGGWEKLDTTGANISVEVYHSRIIVSGTMAFTLPNGLYPKQLKLITCESAAATPACTITVTTPDTTTGYALASTFFMDTPGQGMLLEWIDDITTPAWRAIQIFRAGGVANNVVVGTTVLTGKNLWRNYFLSVTGTVASTIAANQGIPNGSAVGERCLVGCSTAATIPSGTIQLVGVTNAGVTGTRTLGTYNATTVYAELEWDGQQWVVIGNTTAVLS